MAYARRQSRVIAAALLLLCLSGSTPSWALNCALKQQVTPQQGRLGLCKFNAAQRAFEGAPAQQAACLTREVRRLGVLGGETVTPFLKELLGKPAPTVQAVQSFLDSRHVTPEQIGGPMTQPIRASYFIIHDTSAPNCSEVGIAAAKCPTRGAFPPNRDEASWPVNQTFDGHPQPAPHRLAHVFNNRVGASVTETDFSQHLPTTKFEQCADAGAKKALFVGVENIQPRIGAPPIPAPGKAPNDFDAPDPGFAPKQYERLALLYVVASARRGQWLIPVFHAVLDQLYADGHDDPQHFDMAAFSAAVQAHVDALPAP